MSNPTTPREIDEALAALYYEMQRHKVIRASRIAAIYYEAGARRTYSKYGRNWTMSFEEAHEKVVLQSTSDDSWVATHADKALEQLGEIRERIGRQQATIEAQEKQYTGWSRFFVVTSSQGHIHSSLHCSSCYDTTTYGWLPQLSGKSESEAVEACGPALCSVCFPSAPVEQQGGKISEQDAKELANGKTIAELQAAKQAEKDAKVAAKAEKARKAAERARKLMAKVDAFYDANGGYEAVMAREKIYDMIVGLPAKVHEVIYDDHQEYHGQRRWNKDPRKLIQESE